MKRLVLALFLTLTPAVPAMAQGPYLALSGGVANYHTADSNAGGGEGPDIEYDAGYAFNVAAGYKFKPVRVEAEFGYQKAGVDRFSGARNFGILKGVNQTVMSYMLNGYYELNKTEQVAPFVGLGVGMIKGKITEDTGSGEDTALAYQVAAGLSIAATEKISVDIYYRFQGATSDLEILGRSSSYDSSNVLIGMRYNF